MAEQHNRIEVSISSLADRMDDVLRQTREVREHLVKLECALVLAGAALRSDADRETNITTAMGYLRGLVRGERKKGSK